MDNPYEAPQAALNFADETSLRNTSEQRNAFQNIDTPALRKLFKESQSITAIGQFIVIIAGFMLFVFGIEAPVANFYDAIQKDLTLAFTLFYSCFLLLCAIPILVRNHWGQLSGKLACLSLNVILLWGIGINSYWIYLRGDVHYVVYIGCLIVLLLVSFGSYLTFRHCGRLFGPNRITHAALRQELTVRDAPK